MIVQSELWKAGPYGSDFQPGFREHLRRVPRLISKKIKNNLACEITSDHVIEVLRTECLVPN